MNIKNDKKNAVTLSGILQTILIVGVIAGIVICIWRMGTGHQITPRESGLMSIILTVLSILATWIVAHLYGERQHKEAIREVKEMHSANLRTYALKAAEKVNNLSNELQRLGLYLKEEFDNDDYDSPTAALQGKEERIESAMHMIQGLKSFNDTSLSDWKGVIDDEINQQKQQQAEREEEIRELAFRVESWLDEQQQESSDTLITTAQLQSEVRALRDDIRKTSFGLTGGIGFPQARVRRSTKQEVNNPCPHCDSLITYRQKAKSSSYMPVTCDSCGKKAIGTYSNTDGFSLEKREPRKEQAVCPECSATGTVELDIIPGCAIDWNCTTCGAPLRVVRAKDEIRVKKQSTQISGKQLTDTIVQKVREELPEQPWPTGIHKSIAEKLDLTPSLVSQSIACLIKTGVCYPQTDGKVFKPEENDGNA